EPGSHRRSEMTRPGPVDVFQRPVAGSTCRASSLRGRLTRRDRGAPIREWVAGQGGRSRRGPGPGSRNGRMGKRMVRMISGLPLVWGLAVAGCSAGGQPVVPPLPEPDPVEAVADTPA